MLQPSLLEQLHPSAEQRNQRRLAGCPLNDPASLAAGKAEVLREGEHLRQPVHHLHLQLSAGGGGVPGEANAGNGRREHVTADGRIGVGRGEVGVKAGRMPVGHLVRQ